MQWHNIYLQKSLVGDPIEKAPGKNVCFVKLPKDTFPEKDYGFYVSAKLVSDDHISIPENYHVVLEKDPAIGGVGRRYILTGGKLVESILKDYLVDSNEKRIIIEKSKRAGRDERNKQVIGDIVYGRYMGTRDSRNTSGGYFFMHDGIYYNGIYQRVQNVKVYCVIMRNVSKFFFDQYISLIEKRLEDWHRLRYAIAELDKIKSPSDDVSKANMLLQAEKDAILKSLQEDLK